MGDGIDYRDYQELQNVVNARLRGIRIASVPGAEQAIGMCTTNNPTPQASGEVQFLFTYFNEKLFNSTLPECLITPRTKNQALGYFAPDRFVAVAGERCHEIALDPKHFDDLSATAMTLVHEMAHLWQHVSGTPSRGGYHNKEWAEKMKSVGLIPSDTGQPGGKQTGQPMLDYVAEGGPFARAIAELIESGFKITWSDAVREKPKKTGAGGRRDKYTCTDCGFSAWAKPGATIVCGSCHPGVEPMAAEVMS